MTEVCRPLYLDQAPLLFTAKRSAELIKYAANAFLALKISFINEIADLCEVTDVDVQEVARGMNRLKPSRPGQAWENSNPTTNGLLQRTLFAF